MTAFKCGSNRLSWGCSSSLVFLEVISSAQILLIVQTTGICHSNFSFFCFYNSLVWNLEICSHLFLYLFFPVFFSALYLIHPSILFYSFFCSLFCFLPVFIHFIFWYFLLFSFQICYPSFSFLSYYNSILSASPLCAITFQSVLFLLEPSIWSLLLSLFALASVFFILLLFYKDLMAFPFLCSYLSIFSLSLYFLSVLFMIPFALVFAFFSLLLYSFPFLFSSVFSFICCSCSYCLLFFY